MDFITLLRSSTVEEAMTSPPLCFDVGVPLRVVLRSMLERRTSAVLVCRAGAVCGIFTERDFLPLAIGEISFDQPLESLMKNDPVTLPTRAILAEAIRKMSLGGYRHLPIVDDQHRPVGMIKVKNIVHFLVEHLSRAVYNATPEAPLLGREGA